MSKLYVQYGCGLSAPAEWLNFDVSPTLRIQKTPIIGSLLKGQLNTVFPDNVNYGNIINGLPVQDNSCEGVFCSHTLEHLSLADFRTALKNTYDILKPNGIFRCIVPDLEYSAREYIKSLDNNNDTASINFINETMLGIPKKPQGVKKLLSAVFGNSHHLWMWDKKSLALELKNVGFKNIRVCSYNDSADSMFKLVEEESRFIHAVAIECNK